MSVEICDNHKCIRINFKLLVKRISYTVNLSLCHVDIIFFCNRSNSCRDGIIYENCAPLFILNGGYVTYSLLATQHLLRVSNQTKLINNSLPCYVIKTSKKMCTS